MQTPQQRPGRKTGIRSATSIGMDRTAMGRGAVHPQHPRGERAGIQHVGTTGQRRPPAQAQSRRDLPRFPERTALARLPRRHANSDCSRLRGPDHTTSAIHRGREEQTATMACANTRSTPGGRCRETVRVAGSTPDNRLVNRVSTVAGKGVILDRTATTTCRGCMSGHCRQEPGWTSRARSRRQGRQPRGAGAERSDAP